LAAALARCIFCKVAAGTLWAGDLLQTPWIKACSSKPCIDNHLTYFEAFELILAALAQSVRPFTGCPAGQVKQYSSVHDM
jgi:hypothetical protein